MSKKNKQTPRVIPQQRYFIETSPSITRAALAQELAAVPEFAALEPTVYFGSFLLELYPCEHDHACSIEFVLLIENQPRINEGKLYQAEAELHRRVQAKYGGFVEGRQPPARPEWVPPA